MPLYFFHLHDSGEWLIDAEGIEVINEAGVAAKALEQARDVIAADVLHGDVDLGSVIAVENETGTVVHVLRFSDAVAIAQPCSGTPPSFQRSNWERRFAVRQVPLP